MTSGIGREGQGRTCYLDPAWPTEVHSVYI